MGNNETEPQNSVGSNDISIRFAGHLLIIFYCIIFIFGFLGNLAVIYVGLRKKKYRNVTNCYVINLALADLLFLTLSIPYTTYLGLVNTHPFGEIICKMYTYLAYVFLLATCNTLSAMSIDRCFYIVFPKSKLQWRTPRNTLFVCIFIWIASLALILPYHFITAKLESCTTPDHTNFFVCFLIFCSYYAIPLLIIIICYTKLAMHVIQSDRLLLSQTNTKDIPKSMGEKQRHVTRMVVVVTLAFAICWGPIHILELMKCANSAILYRLLVSYPKVLYTIRALSHALAYLNSCLNPYLYALLNRNFYFDLMGIIPSCMSPHKQSELLETRNSLPMTKIGSAANTRAKTVILRRIDESGGDEEEDDDGIYYRERRTSNNADTSCQVDLRRR